MLELDDTLMEPFLEAGVAVPIIRFNVEEPPAADLRVGDTAYHYDRSYPIKGHSAVMPAYLREQLDAGKKPLLIERPDRFYVYLAA